MVLNLPYVHFMSLVRRKLSHYCSWDRLGIAASGFCLVHCVFLTLVLAIFPIGFHNFEDQTHMLLFFLVVPVATYSLVRGYAHHRKAAVLGAGLVGVLLLYGSLMTHGIFGEETLEHSIAASGSLFLIWAHFKNLRSCSHNH